MARSLRATSGVNAAFVARLLAMRATLKQRERWSREQLEAHQAAALRRLRDHASSRSPFYRRFHHGLGARALHELPVLTKDQLIASFDEIVTERTLRLADVREHVARMDAGAAHVPRLGGRWFVAASAGLSGTRGYFVYDAEEWAVVLASLARGAAWAGIDLRLLGHLRLAIIGSAAPWHASAIVGDTLPRRLVETLHVDARRPTAAICDALNEFRPDVVAGYASALTALAVARDSNLLDVAPRALLSSSENLTPASRRRIREAFGVEPFELYATTETSTLAAECRRHRGLHLFEDLVVPEVVDDRHQPVPPGEPGAKLLVTVLFAHTLPLIRYELDDSLELAETPCACGLPFSTLASIHGRAEDTLELPGETGAPIKVRPVVLEHVLDGAGARGWQVASEEGDVRVRLLGAPRTLKRDALALALDAALRGAGARPRSVAVELVDTLEKGPVGRVHPVVPSTPPPRPVG